MHRGRRVRECYYLPGDPGCQAGPIAIELALPRSAQLRLIIVDLQGRLVARLMDATRPAGRYYLTWSGVGMRGPAPSGIYFVCLEAAGSRVSERFVIAR